MRTEQQYRLLTVSSMTSSSDPSIAVSNAPAPTEPKKKVNMAMKFYLEKKREHDAFIAQERSEFELGKKHLANMMGMEAEAMSQDDIDKAIEYLFPSGLYLPKSRPMMKPPEEVKQRPNLDVNKIYFKDYTYIPSVCDCLTVGEAVLIPVCFLFYETKRPIQDFSAMPSVRLE